MSGAGATSNLPKQTLPGAAGSSSGVTPRWLQSRYSSPLRLGPRPYSHAAPNLALPRARLDDEWLVSGHATLPRGCFREINRYHIDRQRFPHSHQETVLQAPSAIRQNCCQHRRSPLQRYKHQFAGGERRRINTSLRHVSVIEQVVSPVPLPNVPSPSVV
jgi:hypothetical protein